MRKNQDYIQVLRQEARNKKSRAIKLYPVDYLLMGANLGVLLVIGLEVIKKII